MNYENKILQHHGIIAGVCQEIKLSDTIDRLFPKPNRKVSVGNAVQAMHLRRKPAESSKLGTVLK